ncbi:hypothetical protein C8Q76DRAFT_752258 [Earliella scabrosa]|nr:hypothetical protein C8Q76DRAFT_752258 [Earliella scabrosa]
MSRSSAMPERVLEHPAVVEHQEDEHVDGLEKHDLTTPQSSHADADINQVLPTEILVEIFKLVRPSLKEQTQSGLDWLRILLVCRHWHSIATSAASLWTRILIPRGPTDQAEAFLKLCLARSRGAHISITFLDSHTVLEKIHLLYSHRHRLRYLVLCGIHQKDLRRGFLPLVNSEYPALTHLVLRTSHDSRIHTPKSIALDVKRFPSLKFLYFSGVYVCPTSTVLPQIEHLQLEYLKITHRALAYTLSKSTALTVLAMRCVDNAPHARRGENIFDYDTPPVETLRQVNPFASLRRVVLLDHTFTRLGGYVISMDIVGILSVLPRQPFHAVLIFQVIGRVNSVEHSNASELTAKEEFLHRLQCLSLSEGPAPVARLTFHREEYYLAVYTRQLDVVVMHPLPTSRNVGESDLEDVGPLMRCVPIRTLAIRYDSRTTCSTETGWSELLNTFPTLQELLVFGPGPKIAAPGALRILTALQPLRSEHLGEHATPTSDTHLQQHEGTAHECGCLVCPLLGHVQIVGFETDSLDELTVEAQRLLHARSTLNSPIKLINIATGRTRISQEEEEHHGLRLVDEDGQVQRLEFRRLDTNVVQAGSGTGVDSRHGL